MMLKKKSLLEWKARDTGKGAPTQTDVGRTRCWVRPGCFSEGRKVWGSVFAATTSTLAWTSPVTSANAHGPIHLPPWAVPASRWIRYPAWLLMAAIQKMAVEAVWNS